MMTTNVGVLTLISRASLAKAQRVIHEAAERLATGKRINRASDDPSGLIAADNLALRRVKLEGIIDQAERAGFVLAAVDGALGEMGTMLVELQGLVVRAANRGGLGEAEREAMQVEANGILQGIEHLINTSTFNGKRILAEGVMVEFDGSGTFFGPWELRRMGQVSGPGPEPVPNDPPAPASLPGRSTTGLSLADLFAGGALNLVDGDLELAQKSVDRALEALNRTRGGIGNHLKYVLGSGLNYLRIELENTVVAESMIRDADFAEEVSKLMRGQIMELASIRTFQLAKEQAFGVLALLG